MIFWSTRFRRRNSLEKRSRPRSDELRGSRFRAVPAPLLCPFDGAVGQAAGSAHRRHCRGAVGLQQLPPQYSRTDRGGVARRAGGRRHAAGLSHHFAGRGIPQSHQHEIPQPDGDGYRGDDPRPADGRGGADRRLRQDRAGPADGGAVGRSAGGAAGHRPHVHRPPQGRKAGRLHRLPALLGALSRRRDRVRRDRNGGRPPGRDHRHLRRDGHRLQHGLHRRDSGNCLAGLRRHSGRQFRAAGDRRKQRPRWPWRW